MSLLERELFDALHAMVATFAQYVTTEEEKRVLREARVAISAGAIARGAASPP